MSTEPAQRTAARVAGFLYLFTNATAIAAFSMRGRLTVRGDAVCVVALVWALYVVLERIDRNLALLAAFWRLAENIVLSVITLNAYSALALLSGADYLRAVEPQQLQALAYMAPMGLYEIGLGLWLLVKGIRA